ncbi:hypothetical protein [Roseibium sp.]|uniref:hypothetical protein n=1 Tax=Roseibium sp. TaxID=1936156 RepID=UPI00391DB049
MSGWKKEFPEDIELLTALQSEHSVDTYKPVYSRDALDQWSYGHGRAFLNEYKSKIQLKYFAKIRSDSHPRRPIPGDIFNRLLNEKPMPLDSIVQELAAVLEKDGTLREEVFKTLYVFLLYLQREKQSGERELEIGFTDGDKCLGSDEPQAAEKANTGAGSSDRQVEIQRTFVPLPLRDHNVSKSAIDGLLPELDLLPSFQFPVRNGIIKFPKAIVGVIDDAVNFTNERFKAEWGTRTEFAWIQDAKALCPRSSDKGGDTHSAGCSDRVFFGREFYQTEIDQIIAECSDDPDELLKAFELDPVNNVDRPVGYLHGSHGTHIADLATGYGMQEYKHHNIRMQTVQLPALAYFDNSGMAMSYFILEGVKFILWRSLFLQMMMNIEQTLKGEPLTKLPVVLNVSYGLSGGPHSGGHYLENGIDNLIKIFNSVEEPWLRLGPIDVVVPAGNDFLSRRFATARIGEAKLNVTMRVPARDRTSNFLEFWLPSTDGVHIEIKPPAGLEPLTKSEPLELNAPWILCDGDDVIARVTLDQPFEEEPDHSVNLARVLLAIAPTDTVNTESIGRAPRTPAQPGKWEVTVTGLVSSKDVIEAYIHSEDPNNGFPRRDPPCYFDMEDYERYVDGYRDWQLRDKTLGSNGTPISAVRRFGTLNGFGNGRFATVVGAYRIKTLEESLYSGAARRLAQSYYGRTPSLMAPADLSRLNRGILASGTRSGSSFTQTGTSISTPFITRALAEAAGQLSAISSILETAAEFEEEIGNAPNILSEQKGQGRYPLTDLNPERELQLKRGLYK